MFHLTVLEFRCWTVETEKTNTFNLKKKKNMSANTINMIISGTTATVRVRFADP